MKALWILNSELSGFASPRVRPPSPAPADNARCGNKPRRAPGTSASLRLPPSKGDEQRALDAGGDGYIAKPIDTRTLPAQGVEFLTRAGGDNSGKPT